MNSRPFTIIASTGVLALVTLAQAQTPVGTAFTYQGRLNNNGSPANGIFTMDFKLFIAVTAGAQVGSTITVTFDGLGGDPPPVANGLFTVVLDFGGGAFTGDKRWLDITVNGTPLSPRQPIFPVPYALALPGLYTQQNATCPNVIGGFSGNAVPVFNVHGATIGGGGGSNQLNQVTDNYGTIGGGLQNTVGNNASGASDREFATVAGGFGNTASGSGSTVAGGDTNSASNTDSTVSGGTLNMASGLQATVGGGRSNTASDANATVAGGTFSSASGAASTVGGGSSNNASGPASTIAGGASNVASVFYSTVGGGDVNMASGFASTIAGGYFNTAQGDYSFAAGQHAKADQNGTFVWSDNSTNSDFTSTGTNQFLIRATGGVGIGTATPAAMLHVVGNLRADGMRTESNATSPNVIGGFSGNNVHGGVIGATIGGGGNSTQLNSVLDAYGTVSGGLGNTVGNNDSASFATVAGGAGNTAGAVYSTISGGTSNVANSAGQFGVVGGGQHNSVLALAATVAGGDSNTATGAYSTVGGGFSNTTAFNTSQYAVVGGGHTNVASGNASTVPGGEMNSAAGNHSFAAGFRAKADSDGCFVWADESANADFVVTNSNQFLIRAAGGVGLGTNSPTNQLSVNGNADVSGSVGIGRTIPQARAHVASANLSIPAAAISGDTEIIEGNDAILGLFSPGGSGYGSGIALREINAGALVDTWSIVRRNNGAVNPSLRFTYGAAAAPGGNATLMSLSPTGNLGIGRFPTTNRLEVEGDASKTTAGDWMANSDARIKTGVETVTHALDTLDKVRLVSFRYTDSYRRDHRIEDRRYLNVIAQEFKEVFPDSVKSSGEKLPNGEPILQVDDHPLTIYSAAAVQELHRVVMEKDREIAAQRKQIADLAARLERIEMTLSTLATARKETAR